MTEEIKSRQRRRLLLITATAISTVPLASMVIRSKNAMAADDLPHVTEDDPTAAALQYHQDASKAPRADKPGIAAGEQYCKNCQLIQADSGTWRPCQLFPGKAVNENGWCLSWIQQA